MKEIELRVCCVEVSWYELSDEIAAQLEPMDDTERCRWLYDHMEPTTIKTVDQEPESCYTEIVDGNKERTGE
jgi:hypothetical protein